MQQVLQALEPSHLLDFLQDVLSSELAKKELFKDAFLQVFLAATQLCLIVIFLAYFGWESTSKWTKVELRAYNVKLSQGKQHQLVSTTFPFQAGLVLHNHASWLSVGSWWVNLGQTIIKSNSLFQAFWFQSWTGWLLWLLQNLPSRPQVISRNWLYPWNLISL